MFDIWQEIFSTIRKNKLRTFLTGFSMAWGIFMLIILLGAGNGLKNGMMSYYEGTAKNVVYMWPGYSSMPYKGLQKGRRTKFDEKDEGYLKQQFPEISSYANTIEKYGLTLSYGKEYSNINICGTRPEYGEIENIEIKAGNGRFLNHADLLEKRKVMVIHKKIADILFKGEPALGKYVVANKVAYQLVGIYGDDNMNQNPPAYIPFTTAEVIFNPQNGYNEIVFTLEGMKTTKQNELFEEKLRERMGSKHSFDPKDRRALWMWNKLKSYMQNMGIFNGIALFIWIIGIGTLIAGIVGVSNIMLITVKERTKEFGIRKALGATPFSILKLIVLEALVITGFFGYIGMVAGVGITELIAKVLAEGGGDMRAFKDPTVELPVVIAATVVLIVAGVLAGYFPARKAVSVKPIEALRYE